ncbi:MAG: nucleotidyl transferase AbiEii/AbiGii toxin family protein [Candidatus Thorarchaeota archaeon]|nr:MAG: hypothetical protein DRP70_13265 [Spirochaetota bacterium]RKX90650.1 MAG: hypothetical protein DRZ90_16195 [Spirochaetota bacterium]
MTQEDIRKYILKALYRDEFLYARIVLKGGNALALIYQVGNRSSLDLDFSIDKDFEDIEFVSDRIYRALISTFEPEGVHVFDYSFDAKPKVTTEDWWGGYRAEFKLIPKDLADSLNFDIDHLRRRSLLVDTGSQKRKFSIEISKFEYIKDAQVVSYEGTEILVYTPVLLAVEKLRALLQQHKDYPKISAKAKRSRARDLYDIWAICDYFAIKLEAFLETVESVFSAKNVSMELLNKLDQTKELHFASWSDVEISVEDSLEDFDYYFEFVNKSAKRLYTRWKVDSP